MQPPHELEKKAQATHQRKALCVYQLMEAGEEDYVGMGL
jgi:hypothetical protein